MANNPEVKALARQAAVKIKALTVAHESQIAAIYQEYREQVANLEGSNADELHKPSVTPIPSPPIELKQSYDFTLRQ